MRDYSFKAAKIDVSNNELFGDKKVYWYTGYPILYRYDYPKKYRFYCDDTLQTIKPDVICESLNRTDSKGNLIYEYDIVSFTPKLGMLYYPYVFKQTWIAWFNNYTNNFVANTLDNIYANSFRVFDSVYRDNGWEAFNNLFTGLDSQYYDVEVIDNLLNNTVFLNCIKEQRED